MKKFYISTIVDCTFTVLSIFLISFVVYNCFYSRGVSLALAFFSTTALSTLLIYFLIKKRRRFYQNELLNKNAENLIFSLNFYKGEKLLTLFEKALKLQNYEVEKKENHLFLPKENVLLYFRVGFEKVRKIDIVKAYNLLDFSKKQKVYIFAESFDKEILDFSLRFNGTVNLLNKTVIYKLLKKSDILSEIEIAPVALGPKKLNLKSFFTKKRAKSYLTSGIIFLVFSFFVFYKVYYIITGCILLILAVICIFLKPQEEQNSP